MSISGEVGRTICIPRGKDAPGQSAGLCGEPDSGWGRGILTPNIPFLSTSLSAVGWGLTEH